MRVGVDVGGTFTDAVAFDEQTGEITRTKVLTTAHDQSQGTIAAISRLAPDPAAVTSFHHGYTVGLNAGLTRRGAKAGLLVTAGWRDLMDTGRLWRPLGEELYDPNWVRPQEERPLVRRRLRREIPERMRHDGEVLLELDEQCARREIEFLRDEGVEAIGICFMHGYRHPEHERRVHELVKEIMPDAYVQTSEIWPLAREFERTFVVSLDAVTGPPVVRYLDNLEARLAEEGFRARVEVMQVDGGLRTSESSKRAPVYTLMSGPVAGILGAEFYSRELLDGRSLACLDIGGTSSDLGLVRGGQAELTNEWQLEHGIPLAVTMLDIRSIGAGGGSLVRVDEVGSIVVGPESAGSDPGPACYGRGATRPAMTDCYVAMGLLAPDLFLGGEMPLDVDAARGALRAVAQPLGMSSEQLAEGAYAIANTKIAAAIGSITVERGLDPREMSLCAYGAAGPMHAVAVARELGIADVIVPYFPGGFSAFGMTVGSSRVEHAESVMCPFVELTEERLAEIDERLAQRCRDDLHDQGIGDDAIAITFGYYAMYAGQGMDNRLPLPAPPYDAETLARTAQEFHEFYDWRYGYTAPEIPIFVTSIAAVGVATSEPIKLPELADRVNAGGTVEDAVIRHADLRLDGEVHPSARFYDRDALRVGDQLAGPCVIDDRLGTVVVNGGAVVNVLAHGTLRIDL
jgi:N-methylhydantoinase A